MEEINEVNMHSHKAGAVVWEGLTPHLSHLLLYVTL